VEVVGYFQNIYKAQPNVCIIDQLEIIKNYPRMFTEEDNIRVCEQVTSVEILKTLKGFKGSKSPGPDGWTVEFFLVFYDIFGNNILEMVE
jgi:hypothetical protein